MAADPKNYEIAYLINPDVAEDEVFGEAGKITASIQDAHGLVGRIEEPKRRRLAYPVRKHRQAYFGWTIFTIAPERIAEIEKRVRQEPNVVRFLICEEVKRPPPRAREPRLPRRVPAPRFGEVKPFAPAPPREEDKAKIEELDKQLEEILGK
ncbi:MAG: 30S ribosomal protein S6 [Candidatus Sungbacteria bacterium RIFCSPLOWO2_01_FULL_59_16]|uniref:Small ribosomal subunit protein bS6 n=1 Tax=Candidatus Sungbacteria bacterium RIFCSPLOWO2_01_FULL_59_16 TaxID=1802280 RepID=A0A1G2LB32_9BACT|nr:MAG: 30S ribosomal protein S6 [Candidatus Sungbacteria bacterium RIFCSPLOWO2_01_FULL_59_16]